MNPVISGEELRGSAVRTAEDVATGLGQVTLSQLTSSHRHIYDNKHGLDDNEQPLEALADNGNMQGSPVKS